jgi:hypothetical protein
MAKNKNVPNPLNNETNLSIYADHLGLTPNFIKQHRDKLNKIEKQVEKSLKDTNKDDPNTIFDTMGVLKKLTEMTYVSDAYENNLNVNTSDRGSLDTKDGFRMIYGEAENRYDTQIFNFHASLFSNYRNLVSEYRNISRLIQEVDRCADMKSRDILAINEITKRSITNIYQPESKDPDAFLPSNLVMNPINKSIQEKILDRYEVEEKLPRYIKLALIEGARPVVVYPFKDIIEMANYNVTLYRRKFVDFNMKYEQNSSSTESFHDFLLGYHNKNQRIVPDEMTKRVYTFGQEDMSQTTEEDFRAKRDAIIKRYVSDDELNEYFVKGCEDISNNLDIAERKRLLEIYGSNVIDKTSEIEETKSNFQDLHAKVKIDGSLSEHFKNQIFNAIKTLDSNIEFFDQSEAPMSFAINNFRRLMQFASYHEDPSSGLIAYDARQQPSKKLSEKIPKYFQDDPMYRLDNKNRSNEPKSILDEFEDFNDETNNVLNDCLIKEYDAEDMIPIVIAGKHVGYYALEMSPYTGNAESINKRNCNFTDMFINLGINNDLPLSPSPSTTGSFSAGVQTMPLGGVGPTSEISSIGITGAGTTAMAGGLDIAGFDITPMGDDALHRNNIMKKIIFNVLKDKLKRKDIDDDEFFTDTIMALIRDGAIIQNKIKVIYIPSKYVCYFSPEIDGNGIPQSFMKNCLFTCYEKILVNMNNIMTRLTRTGTRDKITVNIGKAKNMGYSIRSIENALSTRRLNVESPFTSLSRVLKSASLSETIIVPVFEGEKLFEYEDLTRSNEVQPQDDLEQKLSNEIVTSLKCPITITNPYQEEDFASLAASRNAEYRFDIIKQQKVFTKTIEKFLKLLFVGSGLYAELKEGNPDLSLKNIKVTLSAPETLNMKNANETFGTVQSYVENLLGIIVNPDDSSEVTNMLRWILKKRLYQRYMPGVDFDTLLNEVDRLRDTARKDVINQKKDDSINNEIVNTSFEPVEVDNSGDAVVRGDSNKDVGLGNGDSGDNESDDSGGGDDMSW